MNDYIGSLGRTTIASANHLLNLLAFTRRILGLFIHHPMVGRSLVRRITLEQLYFTAVQALPIIIPIGLLLGSVLIIQFTKAADQLDLGKTTVIIIIRELGPVLTALIVILRSATAVTIETAYMTVLHEIQALEMAGIDPLWIVCWPRLIGITAAILSLFVVFDLIAIVGGNLVVWLVTDIPVANLLQQIAKAITGGDIVVGIVKAIFFGITITVTCLYYGMRTERLITGIPVATSKAAVQCFFYCLVINVMISALFYI